MAKITLSPLLLAAIQRTWDHIGSDCTQACDEVEETLTNEAAIESCIDADRLAAYGGKDGAAANEEVKALIKQHQYMPVMRTLKRAVRLV